jgi:hypothetical protein
MHINLFEMAIVGMNNNDLPLTLEQATVIEQLKSNN